MAESFGARLRAHREQREIPLRRIADDTKIKLALLEALERDDVTFWPKGIFRRAYIRSYAEAIGLAPEPVIREFLDLHPDPAESLPEPEPEPTGLQRALAIAMMGSRPLPKPSRSELIARMAAAVTPAAERPVAPPTLPEQVDPIEAHASAPVAGPAAPTAAATADGQPSPRDAAAPVWGISIAATASLCTDLARARDWDDLSTPLAAVADLLGAVGATIWSWDGRFSALRPVWADGYADEQVARMPSVRRDADNALAAAWRDERMCVVAGQDGTTGAVVVPMVTPGGCLGVLALELPDARELSDDVQAAASIIAAQLASVMGAAPLEEAASA